MNGQEERKLGVGVKNAGAFYPVAKRVKFDLEKELKANKKEAEEMAQKKAEMKAKDEVDEKTQKEAKPDAKKDKKDTEEIFELSLDNFIILDEWIETNSKNQDSIAKKEDIFVMKNGFLFPKPVPSVIPIVKKDPCDINHNAVVKSESVDFDFRPQYID